jgi:hypothetical protein
VSGDVVGVLDEVDEARRVVTAVADNLADAGVDVITYWDDVSTGTTGVPQAHL